MLCLTIDADGRRSRHPLRTNRVRLGRGAENDVVIESYYVSTQHAEVEIRDGRVIVRDLSSRNGTFIGDRRIVEESFEPPGAFRLGEGVVVSVADADTDDFELAPEVPRVEPGSDPIDRRSDSSPTVPAPSMDQAADLAPRLLSLLADGDGKAEATALAILSESLRLTGASSALLVRWSDATEPRALQALGEPLDLPASFWTELRSRIASGREWSTGLRAEEGALNELHVAAGGARSGDLMVVLRAANPMMLEPLADALRLLSEPEGEAASVDAAERAQLTLASDGLLDPQSAVMRELHARMSGALSSDLPVLLTGETGVGKEVYARALHACSSRSAGPWRAVNASAIPESLLEAMLFGAEKGAATGVSAQAGLLREADGGTFFLDEIGEMSPALQSKLLRALDLGEVMPVGSGTPVPVDVRIIAATNRDPRDEVESGRFRRDLYYRLQGHEYHLPPLRERLDDLPLLVSRFLGDECAKLGRPVMGLSVKALHALRAHSWPGNVRELRSLVRRLVHEHAGSEPLRATDLPAELREAAKAPTFGASLDDRIDAFQIGVLREALEASGGNRLRAAEALGIGRPRLRRLIEKLGLDED